MTGFRATTADGRIVEDVTPADLRPLLTGDVELVVFESSERGGDHCVQATPVEGGGWQIEVRRGKGDGGGEGDHDGDGDSDSDGDGDSEGDGDDPVRANVPNADAVFDVMRSWANDDGWWVDAFTWA